MILDHVRLTPTFLGGTHSTDTWVLAIVHEDDGEVIVHKLLMHELRRVLATPEVLQRFSSGPEGYPFSHVSALTRRITELQAIVDKRDDRQWDPIVELFHPDMNIPDIQSAVAHLLRVFALAECASVGNIGPGNELKEALHNTRYALWGWRPTQLEKDEAVSEVEDTSPESAADTLAKALSQSAVRRLTAEILWQKLDDIDTLSDQIKPYTLSGYTDFYQRALNIAKQRHVHLKSNGYRLTWPDGTVSVDVATVPADRYHDILECIDHLAQGYAFQSKFPDHEDHAKLLRELFNQAHEALRPPVPMLLHCPLCNTRHIDEGEFATKKHHTHACQGWAKAQPGEKPRRCGHVWRPAIVATVGVEALPGFLNDPEPEVEGQKLIGKRVQLVVDSRAGTISDYYSHPPQYVIRIDGSDYIRTRHEFTVLDP